MKLRNVLQIMKDSTFVNVVYYGSNNIMWLGRCADMRMDHLDDAEMEWDVVSMSVYANGFRLVVKNW